MCYTFYCLSEYQYYYYLQRQSCLHYSQSHLTYLHPLTQLELHPPSTYSRHQNLGPDNQLSLNCLKKNIRNICLILQSCYMPQFLSLNIFSNHKYTIFHPRFPSFLLPLIQCKATSESVEQLTLLIINRF